MNILYFAWLRERVGLAHEELDPPGEVQTVRDLMAWLGLRSAGHALAFADGHVVRCAVDQEFAALDVQILGAKEIAFFPPVTGG
jgi:molybdopterin synthase sulfur carrier subunit